MFIWDIQQFDLMNVYRTFMSHLGPIHDIQQVSNSFEIGISHRQQAYDVTSKSEHLTKFVTCSSDRTIRFWHFIDPDLPEKQQQDLNKNVARNAYSKETSFIVFVDRNGTGDTTPYGAPFDHLKA